MGILNINTHQLIILHYVAVEENISLAAEKLCLSQPTITYHLKDLEKVVGKKLIISKNHRMRLTEEGQVLFNYTTELLSSLEKIDKYISDIKNISTTIRIGVSSILQNIMSSILLNIYKESPDIKFEINSGISSQIIKDVAETKLDLGIVIGYDNSNSNVKAIRIADKSKLVIIASPKSISGLKAKIEWIDLKDYPFVCGSPGSFLNQLIVDKSKACGITPHIILDTFTPEYTKRFIIEGNGITIWHKKDVEKEIKEGQLVCLPLNEDITVSIDLIVPKDSKPQSLNIKKLIHELEVNLNSPDTV